MLCVIVEQFKRAFIGVSGKFQDDGGLKELRGFQEVFRKASEWCQRHFSGFQGASKGFWGSVNFGGFQKSFSGFKGVSGDFTELQGDGGFLGISESFRKLLESFR